MNEELEKRVTERTAELARSNEALERSNLDLQQFAYVASHDLQAPLRSIVGFVQLLQDEYRDKLDEQGQAWIGRTVENAQRMQTLILDLLTYARLDTQGRPFKQVDCEVVFQETVVSLAPIINDTGATITHDPLPTLIGDRSQLVQLFQNLIMNGMKYSENRPVIHVGAKDQAEHWLFFVQDNGIGIAAKHQERIFDIFQRLHTQRTYTGTGLGLAICRRVVQRHGGRIWVESKPGEGSTFYFTIAKQEQDKNG
jgi:light-regulated signal transduction histidine kinase (bacteriophytochrome)